MFILKYLGTQSYYTQVANHLGELIGTSRAIVYTDFVKDVAPLAIALREKGVESWSYHGKNMSAHDKVKAVDNWCPKESSIQVVIIDTKCNTYYYYVVFIHVLLR